MEGRLGVEKGGKKGMTCGPGCGSWDGVEDIKDDECGRSRYEEKILLTRQEENNEGVRMVLTSTGGGPGDAGCRHEQSHTTRQVRICLGPQCALCYCSVSRVTGKTEPS
jgi:hypothetical protein